jgi:XTP/dITP diphosphohydrolase
MTGPRGPTLLLATGNAKKGRELAELCAGHFDVVTLADVGLNDLDVVEDAPDFAGNARKKAIESRTALRARGDLHSVTWVIADDSGLCVDALDGHPGVRSARFAKDAGYAPVDDVAEPLSKDAANNRLLLHLLGAMPLERRRASFACHVAAVPVSAGADDDTILTARGRVSGRIATDFAGGGGFGYDPLFIVDDDGAPGLRGRRMAELHASEKHAISHRGRAMAILLEELAARTVT